MIQEESIYRCLGFYTSKVYDITNLVKYCEEKKIDTKKIDDVVYIKYKDIEDSVDIFYFDFGSIVIWNPGYEVEKRVLSFFDNFVKPGSDLEKDVEHESESVKCVQSDSEQSFEVDEENDIIFVKQNNFFTKLAISYALAQSVKLSSLEKSVDILLNSIQPIYNQLAEKGSIALSKKEISKKVGVLFRARYSINMHSDILDTPEIFWKMPIYEPLYVMTAKLQDVQSRQGILNRRLRIVEDLYTILTNELNVKHSSRVEKIIVILIAIEVLLGVIPYLREVIN